jgi:hypothetical protein
VDGDEVVLLKPVKQVHVPIPTPADRLTLLVLDGIVSEGTPDGDYEVEIVQRDDKDRVNGSLGIAIHIGKR